MDQSALATESIAELTVQSRIKVIRDVQVILDKDLAEMYGVEVS